MAIIFKDDSGDLLTDIDLANPYTNAIKNMDSVIKITKNMTDRFTLQGEKNVLAEKDANTTALANDILAGKKIDWSRVDNTAIFGDKISEIAMMKQEFDANDIFRNKTLSAGERRALAAEEAARVAQADRHEVAMQVANNKKEGLAIKKDTLTLAEKAATKAEIGEKAATIVNEASSYLASIKDPVFRQEEATRLRTEYTNAGNPVATAVSRTLFRDTDTLIKSQRKKVVDTYDKALTTVVDEDIDENTKIATMEALKIKPRFSMPFNASMDFEEDLDPRNTMKLEDGEVAKDVLSVAKYAANKTSRYPARARTEGGERKTSAEVGLENMIEYMKAQDSSDAEIAEKIVSVTLSNFDKAIALRTGKGKQLLKRKKVEFERLVKNGTRASAIKQTKAAFQKAQRDLVYIPTAGFKLSPTTKKP